MAVCWPEVGPLMHFCLPGSIVGYLGGLRVGHSRRWYGSQAAGGTDASIQSPPLPLIPYSLQDKGMERGGPRESRKQGNSLLFGLAAPCGAPAQ